MENISNGYAVENWRYNALFILALPLKVKLVSKYFLKKNIQKKLLSPIFNSVNILLRPKNEWVDAV